MVFSVAFLEISRNRLGIETLGTFSRWLRVEPVVRPIFEAFFYRVNLMELILFRIIEFLLFYLRWKTERKNENNHGSVSNTCISYLKNWKFILQILTFVMAEVGLGWPKNIAHVKLHITKRFRSSLFFNIFYKGFWFKFNYSQTSPIRTSLIRKPL